MTRMFHGDFRPLPRPGPSFIGVVLSAAASLAVAGAASGAPSTAWPGPTPEGSPGAAGSASNPGAGVVVLAQITGVVATQEGHPLPGALVSVFDAEDGDEAQFAVTDAQGRFEVVDTGPGLYSLRAYLAGFLPSPRAQVLVRSEASIADTLLIQMAAATANPGAGTLSELRWLLQRGRRNILKERRAGLGPEDLSARPFADHWNDRPRFPALGQIEGEFGFFAASGSSLGLAESQGVDSGIAYTRFELPSTARGRWEAEARLMESAFASWAMNLSYEMEELDGHEFAAGLGYQRHLYQGIGGFRPPSAPILSFTGLAGLNPLADPQAAWDGAAWVADDFTLGRTRLSTGLTYRRFSHLEGHQGLAPRAVLEFAVTPSVTLEGGVAVRVDGPLGEDTGLLSRVAHADLLALDPGWYRSLAAQRTTRYQAGAEVRLDERFTLGARVFREHNSDQLVRAFESGPVGGGHFDVSNAGNTSVQGFGIDWIRDLTRVTGKLDVGARVSWVVAVVRDRPEDDAPPLSADGFDPVSVLLLSDGAVLNDLSAEVVAVLQPSGTRINAATRWIRHPGIHPVAVAGRNGDQHTTRFDVELVQLIPFADWSGTEWELSLAVRDLFFRDFVSRSLLDELAVARAPRRLVGGLAVRF